MLYLGIYSWGLKFEYRFTGKLWWKSVPSPEMRSTSNTKKAKFVGISGMLSLFVFGASPT